MLRNLLIEPAQPNRSADVVVIGAGIAGLMVSNRLAELGIRTLVLESGSEAAGEDADPLNEVVQVGQPYRGASSGRFRGLGGTSTRWGGAMLPFSPCDFGLHTGGWPVDWPISLDDLEPFFCTIEKIFNLPAGPYEAEQSFPNGPPADAAFTLRSAKWPTFRLRNFAHTLRKTINGARLQIWLNATVVRFELATSGRVTSVTAVSPSGSALKVETRLVIVAAGAIESTRLLLLLDEQHENKVFGRDSQLGHFFFDHLSAPVATVEPVDRRALNRTFGMRFVSGGMRDLRIEPAVKLRRDLALPGAFAHIAVLSDRDSSFTALRDIYRAVQSGSPVNWRDLVKLAHDTPWLLDAIMWRFVERRLLFSPGARLELVLVTEQMPNVRSIIGLAATKRDRMGNPLAQIGWQTSEQDFAAFAALQTALCKWWSNSGLGELGRLEPVARSHWQERLQNSSDIFHPGGTTRMGRSASSGVVDRNLKAFQLENLYVVSTSAFPSGGSANPTFTLMALALRAADHVAGCLGRNVTQALSRDQSTAQRSSAGAQ